MPRLVPGLACVAVLTSWMALCVPCARALTSIDPALESRLRATGVYEAVVRQLQDAYDRGLFERPVVPLASPIAEAGKVTNWNAIFILVDFSDHPAHGAFNSPEFEDLLVSEGTHPTGSLRDYFLENSYGSFSLTGDVVGWYRMPHPRSYYSNFDGVPGSFDDFGFGTYPHNARGLYEDAVAAADPDVDFSAYLNGSAGVKGVFIVHAGFGGESSGDPLDVWSQARPGTVATNDGVDCLSFSTQPELSVGQPSAMTTMGIFAHEFGHSLGLPDLWWATEASGVGDWALMGTGNWNGGGATPSHFCPWAKRRLGFISSYSNLTGDVSGLVIPPASSSPVVYRIQSSAHAAGEFLLLENRQQLGFDAGIPGSGLLVWHVDTSRPNNFAVACGPSVAPPIVRLIQADGLCQMELGPENRGDGGDPFPGTTANTRLGGMTIPDTRTYAGSKSGVRLDNIAEVGVDVTLDVMLSEMLEIAVPDQVATLQAAIDLTGSGDEIRLRFDHASFGHYTIDHPVRITGGWDATFLTQLPLPSVIEGVGTSAPLISVEDPGGEVLLENVLLQLGEGRQVFQPEEAWLGGGIYIESGTVSLTNCRLELNAAGPNDALPARGGAIASINSDLTVIGCSFGMNSAKEGGEIYAMGGSLTIRDTFFNGSTLYAPTGGGTQRGGAVLADGAALWIEDSLFSSYQGAMDGGAVHALGTGTLLGTTFQLNTAAQDGGAVFFGAGALTIDECEFLNNDAGGSGGGVYVQGAQVTWSGGSLRANHSDVGAGGAYLDGPLPGSQVSSVLVKGNTAAYVGGGMVVSGGGVGLVHTVFVGNSALVGGALQVNNSQAWVANSVFTANTGGAILWAGPAQLDYNLYWGNLSGVDVSGATKGPHSLDADPMFVAPALEDFHLAPGSPAIDAGSPLLPADFDGGLADMGIYGGAHDDGQRPARIEQVVAAARGSDNLLTWSFGAAGTSAAQSWVYGASAGAGKRPPAPLLDEVPAPGASWLHVGAGGELDYWVQAVDAAGRGGGYSDIAAWATAVDVAERFQAGNPFPNPFNPSVRIDLSLPEAGSVDAIVYDARGRRVKTLVRDRLGGGAQLLRWDGTDDDGELVSSGLYFLEIRAGDRRVTRKLIKVE